MVDLDAGDLKVQPKKHKLNLITQLLFLLKEQRKACTKVGASHHSTGEEFGLTWLFIPLGDSRITSQLKTYSGTLEFDHLDNLTTKFTTGRFQVSHVLITSLIWPPLACPKSYPIQGSTVLHKLFPVPPSFNSLQKPCHYCWIMIPIAPKKNHDCWILSPSVLIILHFFCSYWWIYLSRTVTTRPTSEENQ